MIQIRNLSKAYGDLQVLEGVNAEIRKGEIISVIGPSGTGKSTLLRSLNLLERPDSGSVIIDGLDILAPGAPVPALRRKMGMFFQSFNLFPHLTVLDNLTLGPVKLLGKNRREAEKRGMDLLADVGLMEKAGNLVDSLSGGQKQRVAIARCLAMEPEIILFDEPTSALDPTMISEVLAVIRRLASRKMTMIIVTHEMDFARDVSTRVFYMDEKGIYEEGSPEQIFQNPQREKTRAFIKRIRSISWTLNSRHYDLYAMNGEVARFAEKHFLSRSLLQNMQLALEESLALFYAGTEKKELHLTLSYSEKNGDISLVLDFWDPADNFMEQNMAEDDLGLVLLKSVLSGTQLEEGPLGTRLTLQLVQIHQN